jgi:hypothetical protein
LLDEVRALPRLPFWLPLERAASAVVEAAPTIIEAMYPELRRMAMAWVPRRPAMTQDDVLSSLTLAAMDEIKKWTPYSRTRIGRNGREKTSAPLNPRVAILAYLGMKLRNGSIERAWISGVFVERSTESIYAREGEEDDGGFAYDAEGSETHGLEAAEVSDQVARVLEVLSKSNTAEAIAAEAVILRESGSSRPPRLLAGLPGRVRRRYPKECGSKKPGPRVHEWLDIAHVWRVWRGDMGKTKTALQAVVEVIRAAHRQIEDEEARRSDLQIIGARVRALGLTRGN